MDMHQDATSPNQNDPDNRANRDPITGAPGSHPVGTGTGAAVGAAVGGVMGLPGGPLGMAVGAAVGGLAGGLVGKSAAEVVNPTEEVGYWRSEFPNRPYGRNAAWDDYEPAYYSTAAAYGQYAGRPFDEIEPELQRAWPTNRRSSRLDWPAARDASRDAWERLAKSNRGTVDPAEREAAEAANGVIQALYDGSKGFQQAADAIKNPSYKSGLGQYARQREAFIAELKPLVASRGEVPGTGGSALGALHRTWVGLKQALTSSDHAILAECERGEDAALTTYRKVLESDDLTPPVRRALESQLRQVQSAHDTVKGWRDAAAVTNA